MVLACTSICLYGMLFFSVINPAQPFADFLVGKLDRGSALSFKAKSIERSFFKEVELKDVSVTLDEATPVISDSLVMDRGMGSLLFSFFGKGKKFTFTFEHPTIDISLAQLELLVGGSKNSSPSLLTPWLANNSVGLNTNALYATFSSPTMSASIQDADLSLAIAAKLELSSFKASVKGAQIHMGEFSFQLDSIHMDVDSLLAISAETDRGKLSFNDVEASFEQLALAGQLSSLDITKGELGIDFSLSNLNLNRSALYANIPK
ncbi:MAG TPA: hypothetical protein VJ869_10660, partial [Sphaerochaeta sp.]|nr:hypothetical protein [Sphaerochaeta sp.]